MSESEVVSDQKWLLPARFILQRVENYSDKRIIQLVYYSILVYTIFIKADV